MHRLTIDREHRTSDIPFDRVVVILGNIDTQPRRREIVHQTAVVDLLHAHAYLSGTASLDAAAEAEAAE